VVMSFEVVRPLQEELVHLVLPSKEVKEEKEERGDQRG